MQSTSEVSAVPSQLPYALESCNENSSLKVHLRYARRLDKHQMDGGSMECDNNVCETKRR